MATIMKKLSVHLDPKDVFTRCKVRKKGRLVTAGRDSTLTERGVRRIMGVSFGSDLDIYSFWVGKHRKLGCQGVFSLWRNDYFGQILGENNNEQGTVILAELLFKWEGKVPFPWEKWTLWKFPPFPAFSTAPLVLFPHYSSPLSRSATISASSSSRPPSSRFFITKPSSVVSSTLREPSTLQVRSLPS